MSAPVKRLASAGQNNPRAKLDDVRVTELRTRWRRRHVGAPKHPLRLSDLAREYGLSVSEVHNIVTRKTWRHLP